MAVTISADGLTAPDALKTVSPTVDSTNYLNDINQSVASIQSLVDANSAAQKTNLDKLASLQATDRNKATDLAAAYDANGLNAEKDNLDKFNAQLNDINANVSGLANEAKAIPLKIQNQFANTGATDAGVAPIQTGQLRENAIKALTQSSLADVLTANINNSTLRYNSAKDKAERAITLKYAPIEQEIADLKEQLKLNKDYISDPAEKKLVAAQEKAIKERERVLLERKQEEKDVTNIALTAGKNGADQATVNAILKTGNSVEAVRAAGKFLKDPLETKLKQAQLDNIYSEIQKRNAETDATNQIDPALGVAYAQQYAATGQIPTGLPKGAFGIIANAAKDLPKQNGTIVEINTGVKSSSVSEAKTDSIIALRDIVERMGILKDSYNNSGFLSSGAAKTKLHKPKKRNH